MSPRKENKYLLFAEGDSPHSNSYGHLPKAADDINMGQGLRGHRGSVPVNQLQGLRPSQSNRPPIAMRNEDNKLKLSLGNAAKNY